MKEAGKKWRNKIEWGLGGKEDPDAFLAIHDSFTTGDFYKMRAIMRAGMTWGKNKKTLDARADIKGKKLWRSESEFNLHKKMVIDFRRGIDTAPEFEGIVYRGSRITEKKMQKTIRRLERKKTFTLEADSSGTRLEDVAQDFMTHSDRPVALLYRFNQRSGKSIENASRFTSEGEVVIRQKTRFDLVKIHYKSDEVRARAIGDLFKFRRTKNVVFGKEEELNLDSKEYFKNFPKADIIIEVEEI